MLVLYSYATWQSVVDANMGLGLVNFGSHKLKIVWVTEIVLGEAADHCSSPPVDCTKVEYYIEKNPF